jgi:sec-independent protein translocase protein TatA
MGSLGLVEILVIVAILLIFFGSKRLPQLGQSVGKAIRGFKESMNEINGEARELPPLDQSKKAGSQEKAETTDQKKS